MTDYYISTLYPGFTVGDTMHFDGSIEFDKDGTNAIEISGISTGAAILVNGVNTANIINITGVWGQGFTQAAVNIGGAAAIAFGSCDDQLVVKRTNITAQIGTAEGYMIGEYKSYATSGAGAGTVLQHGIWMGDYTGLNIGHNTTDAYANRGRTGITGTIAGNQFIGVMGQMDFTGAATLEATGGGYGVYGSVSSSGSGTCNRNVAAGYFTLRSNTINLAGRQSCVVADMGGSGYADYGFLAHVGNNNVAEAGIGIEVSDSAVLPSGVKFTVDTAGSITNAFEFDDGIGCIANSALTGGTSKFIELIINDVAYTIECTASS